MRIPLLTVALPLLAITLLPAQTLTPYIAPFGHQSNEGNTNNTIPWWAGSATYQQVHDAPDLAWVFPAPVALIRGLSFRANAGHSLGARTLDTQITLGITSVTAATATATFASNLGGSPSVTLPYTSVNLPSVSSVSTPNPQAWFFPFAAPFVYVISQGNLCWELRYRNSTSSATAPNDACSGAPTGASFMPLLGAGCTATGRSLPATIAVRSLDVATGTFVNRLENAASSAAATLILGGARSQLTLPGLCAPLETPPLVMLNGTTDQSGTWNHSIVLGNLTQFGRGTVYTQFVFADAGLPYGFGLSTCSPVTLPGASTFASVRIWAVPSSSGQGNENATTGSMDRNYGLVVGFDS